MRFACSLLSRTLKKNQTSAKIKVTLRTLESRNLMRFVRILPVEIAKVFDPAKHCLAKIEKLSLRVRLQLNL